MRKLEREMAAFFAALYPGQTKTLVFGEGDPRADTVLIGEAPGEQEALQGRPFVGKAGANLNELLAIAGIERERLYVTNAVKLRPTRISDAGRIVNRPPTGEEIELFLPWLKKELERAKPKRVVTLGNVALRALLGKSASIGAMHGKTEQWNGAALYPLYHPASLIYRPSLRGAYEEDVRRLGEDIRNCSK